MGNAAGSCCSVKTDNDKKEVISKGGVDPASAPTVATTTSTGDSPMGARGPSAPASVALGAVALKAFQSRLEESIDMIVVIADGKRIPCKLRWTPPDKSLVMTCEVNSHTHIRRMALNELLAVIYGRKDLGRVATRANIVDDPTCVALHLASNTCIPICFQTVDDRHLFAEFIKQQKALEV